MKLNRKCPGSAKRAGLVEGRKTQPSVEEKPSSVTPRPLRELLAF